MAEAPLLPPFIARSSTETPNPGLLLQEVPGNWIMPPEEIVPARSVVPTPPVPGTPTPMILVCDGGFQASFTVIVPAGNKITEPFVIPEKGSILQADAVETPRAS